MVRMTEWTADPTDARASEAAAARRLSRRDLLRAAGSAAAGALLLDGAPALAAGLARARTASAPRFRSRPDLRPPAVAVHGSAAPGVAEEGYIFLGPTGQRASQAGALIVDPTGQPVWFAPVPPTDWTSNFRVQLYQGRPVLTWWRGTVSSGGYGRGEGVVLSATYSELARIRAGGGRHADLHELVLTPEGTALITCHPREAPADLSRLGGPRRGRVLESIIQEVEVSSGRVLLEWRSLEHLSPAESCMPLGEPYDYAHVNSIDVLPDGNLLVSARHTCALYKIHRRTGRVLWRLGGRRSDFTLQGAARFWWQHDARLAADGRITVFDNGAGPVRTESQSRGLALEVDWRRRRVRLARAYRHRHQILADAMGNVQRLATGNVVVGWGLAPVLSEFAADGRLLGDFRLPAGSGSYRGFRCPWEAVPGDPPVGAAIPGASGTTLYASWNGATTAASWLLSVGSDPAAVRPVATVPRSGFETAIALGATSGYAVLTALDASGRPLASSRPVAL